MDKIESLLQRPKLYDNIDGLGELGLGLFGLGWGLLEYLQTRSPLRSIWNGWRGNVWFWLIIAVIYYGTRALKKRITYPRTGFVEYRKRKNAWLYALVLGGATALLMAWCVRFAARSHWDIDGSHLGMTTPVALVALAFPVFYVLHIAGAVRWKLAMAAAMAICSVAIAMLPAGVVGAVAGSTSAVATLDERSFGAWMLTIVLYGAILLTSGAISFVLYLRHTQPPAQASA